MTPEHLREDALRHFIAEARWFGGKGRDFEVAEVRDLSLADEVTTTLVTVRFDDGSTGSGQAETALYQVPIASYDEPQDRIGHALIGEWDDQFHYDAAHDRESMQGWLQAFAIATQEQPHRAFHRTAEHDLDLESHSTLFSGEQSNSSVAFGRTA